MNKISEDEYNKACKDVEFYLCNLKASSNEVERLLDALCVERSCQKMYKECLDKAKEIKFKYEIYQEVKNGICNSGG